MPTDPEEVAINPNPILQKYYYSLESRIGYRLFLGGTRHFGYYNNPSSWGFDVDHSLRAMEEQLYKALDLAPGARVLDSGCGVGHVAIYMATRGKLNVQAIDVVQHHVEKAQRNIKAAGLCQTVTARRMDYHNLDTLASSSLDGIYTMETLVHATDPAKVLAGFYRLLKPGGHLALHEYDHVDLSKAPKDLSEALKKVNTYAAMPSNTAFEQGVLESMLEEAGFEHVELKDLSENVAPMLWLFYIFAVIPYFFVKLFRLEAWFVNTVAGAESYRGRKLWRYVQVTARKPQKGKRSG